MSTTSSRGQSTPAPMPDAPSRTSSTATVADNFEDPFGHRWSVATHIEDVSPQEMAPARRRGDERLTTSRWPRQREGNDLTRPAYVHRAEVVATLRSRERTARRPGRPGASGSPPRRLVADRRRREPSVTDVCTGSACSMGYPAAPAPVPPVRVTVRGGLRRCAAGLVVVRVLGGAALEGEDARILDDSVADFDGPADGLVEGPRVRAGEHRP